jgi:hypothetical protein
VQSGFDEVGLDEGEYVRGGDRGFVHREERREKAKNKMMMIIALLALFAS